MKEKKPVKLEDLLWAREQLRVFTSLERQIKTFLGKNGFELLILKNPFILGLLGFSTIINITGMWLWGSHQGHIFLLSALWPFICTYFVVRYIKKEKSKNIFRFIGKYPIAPMNLINMIEFHIFSQQENLEQIIKWRASKNKMSPQEVERFINMFHVPSWENPKQAQQHCVSLGVLMVSIQRFLHLNRKTYEAQVYRPKKDINGQRQTFNGAKISVSEEEDSLSVEELFTRS